MRMLARYDYPFRVSREEAKETLKLAEELCQLLGGRV